MSNLPEDFADFPDAERIPFAPPYEPISIPSRDTQPRLAYGILIAVGISLAFFLAMVLFFVHRHQQPVAPLIIITPTNTSFVANTATLPHATQTLIVSVTPTPTIQSSTGGQGATPTPTSTLKPKPTATRVPPTVTPTPTATRVPL